MHSFCPEHKGGQNEISIEKQKYKFNLLQNGDKSEFFLLTFSAKEKVRRNYHVRTFQMEKYYAQEGEDRLPAC